MDTPPNAGSPPAPDNAASESADSGQDRRNFMTRFWAASIGALVGLVPLVTGSLFFLSPLIKGKGGSGGDDDDGFVKLSPSVDSLPADGTPQLYTVFADKVDAWNKFLDQPIGSVYLRRLEDGTVAAFNTRCPHLGCAVDYRKGENDFFCPCHTSTFDLDGNRENQIPPRNMDELEVRVDGNQIWVKFQNFRATTEEKIPVT